MTATAVSPALLLTAVVRHVERLSPSFVRIRFGGEGFEVIGPEGPTLDQRIKLLIPVRGRQVPRLDPTGWYAAWLALPEAERGFVRTYTARAIEGEGEQRRLVVDFVLHGAEAHGGGAPGPAGTWAAEASVGDEIGLVAPRRGHEQGFGGIEFAPADARRLALVADETALPALASIAEDLPPDAVGVAVVEVPGPGDFLDVRFPPGIEAHWVARGDRPRGTRTVATLRACLQLDADGPLAGSRPTPGRTADPDEDVWETAAYSSSGDDVAGSLDDASRLGPGDTYAWVAGDSGTVKACRRLLVGEGGLPRHQVAFMGYWKQGRAQ
ncbi:siderophore-interacting protein [Intrasporangium sp. YIM S08009]|uniref:siderophore-interacting protein n=1 Tax=Intrasporangium zincisolvens TaxID=3080018 RepID=UPI002B05CEAA|nr:siderophore-interacting protein [Intrasporangium sp. YIM S08009]